MRKKLFTFLLAIVASVGTFFAQSSGTCGENLTWTLSDDGVLTISGTGAMEEYSFDDAIGDTNTPWRYFSIKTIIIEEGVTSIGKLAFSNCSSLTSIVIPNSVTSIGLSVFANCSSLSTVTIPNSVTSIENTTFFGCSSLTSIVIPNSVTSIGSGAFFDCSSLTSIEIPNSVTSIESSAFHSCSSLTSVTIPNSVTSIKDYAFYGCSSLTSVTIGNSVTSIGKYAFSDCSSLSSVEIPNSVTSIGNNAFYGCSSLTSVTIPNSVTSIGYDAFYQVLNVVFNGTATGTPWGANFMNKYAENGFVYEDESKTNLIGTNKSGDIQIPDGVENIADKSFCYKYGIKTVIFPKSLKKIGERAFVKCKNLISIEIPENVESIGSEAFAGCDGLKQVLWNARSCADYFHYQNCFYSNYGGEAQIYSSFGHIETFIFGDSVQHIPAWLCYGMSQLKNITIPKNVNSVGENVFDGCYNLTEIVWNAKKCKDFTYKSSPFCRSQGYYSYENYDIRDNILNFSFGDDVEYIPAYLCCNMNNVGEIVVPECHIQIGEKAFDNTNYRINGAYSILYPDTLLCFTEDLYIDGVKCNLEKKANIRQTWKRSLTTIDGCDSTISIDVTWKKFPESITISTADAYDTPKSGKITISQVVDGQYDYYTLNGQKNASLYNLSAGEYRMVFYGELCDDSIVKNITIQQYGIRVNNQYYLLDEENCTATLTYRGTSSSDYSNEYSGNITIPQVVTYSGVEYKVIGINNSTFSGCNNIKTITLESSTPLSMNYSGLSSNTIVYVPFGSLNAYKAASEWSNYTLHVIDPTHASATTGATSATITLGDSNEALYIASCGIIEGEATDGNVLEYIGLEPNSTYANLPLYINSTKGDYDTLHYSFTTSALELTTQQSKAISSTTAILLAETNMSDAEVNCGFEWKRENAPDAMAGTKVYCPVANGTMAGRLKGLKDDVYYKYRAFYQSTAGNTYYGDWQYIFTGDDAVEFDPVMYTYAASAVTETEATLKGYALAGSDEFTEQGFEYWAESRVIPEGANHAPVRAYQNAIGEHQSVQATGISMKVTLTNLDEGTVYKYRTYAVVNGAKVYGSEMSFTTRGEYLYTVTFVDYDGTILSSDKVHYGTAATAPEDPSRGGYNFSGWDKDYSNVTDDMTITAQYTVSTALPQATTDSSVQKFIRDGQVLIMRDGKMYNLQGVEMK